MDDPGQQAVHEAVQDWVAEDIPGAVVTKWCLTTESALPDGGSVVSHRAGTLGGDSPSVSEAIGILGGSLAVAIAQFLKDTHDTED